MKNGSAELAWRKWWPRRTEFLPVGARGVTAILGGADGDNFLIFEVANKGGCVAR